MVTVIRGVERGAEELLAALKKLCGAGGAVREEGIEIQGDQLVCTLHGWRFDTASGRCLNAEERTLRIRPAD